MPEQRSRFNPNCLKRISLGSGWPSTIILDGISHGEELANTSFLPTQKASSDECSCRKDEVMVLHLSENCLTSLHLRCIVASTADLRNISNITEHKIVIENVRRNLYSNMMLVFRAISHRLQFEVRHVLDLERSPTCFIALSPALHNGFCIYFVPLI